jgi:lipoyl(octanoyl) transferase
MGTNVRRFISDLEQVLRLTLENFNISADASFHHPGIWIEGRQISAIGLRVSHGVTMHGISLNVNNDLEYSKWINICGISGAEATSLKQLLKQPVSVSDVSPVFLGSISRVFQAKFKPVTNLDDIGISVDVQAA